MPDPKKEEKPSARLIVCRECETQFDRDEEDCCPKCGLDMAAILDTHRARKILKKLEQDDEEGEKKLKKSRTLPGLL